MNRPVGNRSSFTYGWQRSKWAEDVVVKTINASANLRAVAYGFSSDRDDSMSKDDYATLYQSTETLGKRPDILVFERTVYDRLYRKFGPILNDLTNTADTDVPAKILELAIHAIEIEHTCALGQVGAAASEVIVKPKNIKYKNKQLKRNTEFGTYLKDGDLKLLKAWRANTNVPISIIQLYCDDFTRMFALTDVEEAIKDGVLPHRIHKYPEGRKKIYHIWHTLGIEWAVCDSMPIEGIERIVSSRGKISHEITIEGGSFLLTDAGVNLLQNKIAPPMDYSMSLTVALLNVLKKAPKSGITGAEIYQKLGPMYDNGLVSRGLKDFVSDGLARKYLVENKQVYQYTP